MPVAGFSNLILDASNNPVQVNRFIGSGASLPVSPNILLMERLYYVAYAAQEIRKIDYTGNKPPIALASVNKTYGPSPLAVQFTGNASSIPEETALTYLWNFGDGTPTSTAANPTHTYTVTGLRQYTVTLKVTDAGGASSTTKLLISPNNTPPTVSITSPVIIPHIQ